MTDLVDQAAAGTIAVIDAGEDTVVALAGEIDGALRDQASHCMGLALFAGRPVVIDASRATFIDSSGLAFVLQLRMALHEAGLELSVRDPGRVLLDVLRMVGMDGEVTVLDDVPLVDVPGPRHPLV